MKLKFPEEYKYMPETYVLPRDYEIFVNEKLKDFDLNDKTKLCLLKPCASSRGRGIRLLTDVENIPKKIIATHYIYNPHLINGRKYDLRLYLLVTGYCPLKIYLFDNGLARFCSEQYDLNPEKMSNIYIHGAERVGMLTVPAAAGNTTRQIKFIRDFGTTVLHAIPSYASRIYEVMQQEGCDPRKDTQLRVLCIGAEPHSEEQRQRIEQNLGVKAYNSYGISEMMGPGVAFECQEQNGLHIWEDYFIVEIIDPVTLEPVPDGQLGELVLTTINREAMPLLRYRTRDLTSILPGECPCGRHHRRLARLQGRSDDMMILKGVNIFPIQIEKILLKFKELSTDYLITLETRDGNDMMTVEVELAGMFTDDYTRLQQLEKTITRLLKDEILITPKVRLVPKGTLAVSDEKKAVRVKDLRKLF